MSFWPTLLAVNIVIGVIVFLLTWLNKVVWETVKEKMPKLFYFPLKKEHYNGIPSHPTRAFGIVYLNGAVILNVLAIAIYSAKGLSS